MGGSGSGRYPSRATIEDARIQLLCLSIRDWAERGFLKPGTAFTQVWMEGDRRTASIGVQIDTVNPVHPAFAELVTPPVPARLRAVLHYSAIVRAGAPPEAVRDEIWLDGKPRGFALAGLQFICPDCTRRVATLYLKDLYFRCRRCGQLGYQSQRRSRATRALEKAARIKRQLGGMGEYAEPVPARPKGMHQKTYARLCREVAEAEGVWQDEQLGPLQRLLTDYGFLRTGDQADGARTAQAIKRALLTREPLKRRRRARRRPQAETPSL